MAIYGRGDPGPYGWLCPREPEILVTGGPEGAERLLIAGCIDLGFSDPAPSGTHWQVTFDVRDLPAGRVQGFAPGAEYRLILVTGDDQSGGWSSTGVPPVSLVP